MKRRYPMFTFRRFRSPLFLLPTVVHSDDGYWVFHFWRSVLAVKYHPRWVRRAWRQIDADRAAFAKRLCPLCRKHDHLHQQLVGDWSAYKKPIWCKSCDHTFDLYEGEAA